MRFNHIELVEIEEGRGVVIETAKLLPGVTLKVYDQQDAELVVEKIDIPFKWTEKTQDMFGKLDELKAVDLFEIVRACM
ncbi:hypothetical protein [Lederbergia citri]|uniref:Uncharacterized protein n=1 Tax=Lederbergia citri TaxID=2833580 RepID=A0A942YFM6_9BACI|nr:hypothetical protein [Lederbergia citri]MBS4193475.1 hypothetical protein [Lederbergia citri]